MNFLHYLMLGVVAYGCGFGLRYYVFHDNIDDKTKVYQFTAGFFIIMLGVAWGLNNWILGNSSPDFAFISVSSAVATFIFYQGLSPDDNMPAPH